MPAAGPAPAPVGRRRLLRALPPLALLAASLPFARPALAAVDQATIEGARAFMRSLADQAIAVLGQPGLPLAERERQLAGLLANGFDMVFIGRFVVGRHWREMSREQKVDYLGLFQTYVLRTYSRRLGGYAGEQLQITDAKAAGKKDVLVATAITQAGAPPILATWRIRRRKAGYRIIDVMVEGVSMGLTQRSEFGSIIASNGINGLMQALQARVDRFSVSRS